MVSLCALTTPHPRRFKRRLKAYFTRPTCPEGWYCEHCASLWWQMFQPDLSVTGTCNESSSRWSRPQRAKFFIDPAWVKINSRICVCVGGIPRWNSALSSRTVRELKNRDVQRCFFKDEGLWHLENGTCVVEFTPLTKDVPKQIVAHGIPIGLKYSGQPNTCFQCDSSEHLVKLCLKRLNAKQVRHSNRGKHLILHFLYHAWWSGNETLLSVLEKYGELKNRDIWKCFFKDEDWDILKTAPPWLNSPL